MLINFYKLYLRTKCSYTFASKIFWYFYMSLFMPDPFVHVHLYIEQCSEFVHLFIDLGYRPRAKTHLRDEICVTISFHPRGAAAYQLGNTSSRTITEVKQR